MVVHVVGGGGIHVQLRLEPTQSRDDRERCLDRVLPLGSITGVGRPAGHSHGEPQHPDLGVLDAAVGGLGQDRGVGRAPREHTGESAVAAALLLDHRLQVHAGTRGQAKCLEAAHRPGDRGQARLHVARTPAVEPVAVPPRDERGRGPHRLGSGADNVDVTVEHQRAAVHGLRGRPLRHHVGLAGHVPAERRGAGVRAQRLRIQRQLDGLEAELRERVAHHRLPGGLVPQQRGRLDQANEQLLHPRALGGDRAEDLLVGHAGTSSAGLRSKKPTGLSQNDTVSTAITGHSSGRVT